MNIKNPMEIKEETDQITRAVKSAGSFDDIAAAKERLAGISNYVKENKGNYQTMYGDESLRFILKGIFDTGVFIGLQENEILRNSQKDQRRALGYRV